MYKINWYHSWIRDELFMFVSFLAYRGERECNDHLNATFRDWSLRWVQDAIEEGTALAHALMRTFFTHALSAARHALSL